MNPGNEFSWANTILAYYESDKFREALIVFCLMNSLAIIRPSHYTGVATLQTCSQTGVTRPKSSNAWLCCKSGIDPHPFVGTAF